MIATAEIAKQFQAQQCLIKKSGAREVLEHVVASPAFLLSHGLKKSPAVISPDSPLDSSGYSLRVFWPVAGNVVVGSLKKEISVLVGSSLNQPNLIIAGACTYGVSGNDKELVRKAIEEVAFRPAIIWQPPAGYLGGGDDE